jgi:hypothetical protein
MLLATNAVRCLGDDTISAVVLAIALMISTQAAPLMMRRPMLVVNVVVFIDCAKLHTRIRRLDVLRPRCAANLQCLSYKSNNKVVALHTHDANGQVPPLHTDTCMSACTPPH